MPYGRPDRTKLAVCRPYERLRKKWQSFVDGNDSPTDGQSLDEEAAKAAQQKMIEHRESCEVCKKEDLALKEGHLSTTVVADI